MAGEALTMHAYKGQILDTLALIEQKRKVFENHEKIGQHLDYVAGCLRIAADHADAAARHLEEMGA